MICSPMGEGARQGKIQQQHVRGVVGLEVDAAASTQLLQQEGGVCVFSYSVCLLAEVWAGNP